MARYLLLIAGVFFCSTSVIIMRLSALPSALLAMYRLLFAVALLAPIFLFALRQHRDALTARRFLRCVPPGLLLAVHFISWAWGSRLTQVANASLIINLTPAIMPFLARFLIREEVTRREALGTLVALSGVAALSVDALQFDPQYFWGNAICFGSMITFAAYLALGRINRDFPSVWLYMVPIYAIAASACLLFSLVFLDTLALSAWSEAGWMLAMAILPTILGHIALNHSLRTVPAQTLAVVNLHQFVFAGLMGWLIFREAPRPVFYLAAALCVSGAIIVVREAARLRAAR